MSHDAHDHDANHPHGHPPDHSHGGVRIYVMVALALMCLAMGMRSIAWHAILKAALPEARPTLADAFQGTAIGVLWA